MRIFFFISAAFIEMTQNAISSYGHSALIALIFTASHNYLYDNLITSPGSTVMHCV